MASDFERHLETLATSLVSLLGRLQLEGRCMTPQERQRYSIGVRMLARVHGQSIAEVIAHLNDRVTRDRPTPVFADDMAVPDAAHR